MATKKTRIQKAERKAEAARNQSKTVAAALQLRKVNYRTGLLPEFPDPADADIRVRLVDMTQKEKDGET
jgi:hypothetical protein